MRRLAVVGLGALLLALFSSACGGSSGGGSTGSSSHSLQTSADAGASCQKQPVRGGSVTYARQLETVTLNPIEVKNGNGDSFADEMLYTGLVRLDPTGGTTIVPAVAQSWTVSPDGKEYTFNLRPGLKFSNGTPVTAEDVKWNLERFGNPNVNKLFAVLALGYKEATIVNPTTVKVTLKEPVAGFLYDIAIYPAAIVPKEAVEKEGANFYHHPAGTGPFRLKEFVSGSHITFERNPYFWESGQPYLETVRWNFATESNSRVLALKSGEAQLADGIPYSQMGSLESASDLTVQRVPVPAWIGLSLNHKDKPFADIDVRKAIEYAINKQEINQEIFKGVGTVPNSLLPELKLDSKSVAPYEYSPSKAKEYLAKSSYPNGFSATLTYPAGLEYYKQMTLLIQQELQAIGIKIKLVEVSQATVAEKFTEMDYEMTFPFPQWSSDIPIPDEFAGFYALKATGTNGFFTGWEDPAISAKVQTFRSTPSESTREQQWPVIQKELLEQTPAVNVLDVPFINAHQSNVCGTYVNALGVDQLELTWLAAKS
jgi:peptide/nickel transport system substrate-binding protein